MDLSMDGKLSLVTIGASIDFDHDWHNQNAVMLVADLASQTEFLTYAAAQAWLDAN